MFVVVGVSGGIAAYKAVQIVRLLVLEGHDVHVVPTADAVRFVGLPTWEAISRNPVTTSVHDDVASVRHVSLGQSADLVIVAPATANTLAKMATGLADDLLGTTLLATQAPVVVAPAMHTEMWRHPATQQNIETLRARGAIIVGPGDGRLTGSDSGPGRMSEPDEIVDAALAAAGPRDLVGRRIVVSAGGTREPLDPVRFLGNRSSGKQGVAIAAAAAARGAEVTLVAANIEVPAPAGVRVVQVGSAMELSVVMEGAQAEADVVIMAAAVADYRPAGVSDAKIKKEDRGDELELRLVKNPDILQGLAERATVGQTVIGFAAETAANRDELLELGRRKLDRKGCDFLVLNIVGWNEGFAQDGNRIIVLRRGGDIVGEAAGSKLDVAHRLLDVLV